MRSFSFSLGAGGVNNWSYLHLQSPVGLLLFQIFPQVPYRHELRNNQKRFHAHPLWSKITLVPVMIESNEILTLRATILAWSNSLVFDIFWVSVQRIYCRAARKKKCYLINNTSRRSCGENLSCFCTTIALFTHLLELYYHLFIKAIAKVDLFDCHSLSLILAPVIPD